MISDDKYVGWIYMILNEVNGKIYIGQTYNKNGYRTRWNEHKSNLRNNNHGNKHLQCAWSTYGEESFEFILLHELVFDTEIDLKRNLNIIEIYYIHEWNLTNDNYGYNISKGGDSGSSYVGESHPMYGKTHSEDSKNKISKNHANFNGSNNPNARAVNMIDIKTNKIIKTFNCISDANEYLGVDRCNGNISCSIRRNGTAWGYKWKRVDDDKEGSYKNKKKVAMIDISTNNIIKIYETVADANEDMTGNRKGCRISDCINGKQCTAFGYIWKEVEDDRVILMIDRDNFDILNIFDTYKDVRMYLGINKSSDNVSNSLNGNSGINTCMGYKWRYADRNGNIKYTQYDRKEYIKLGMFNKHTGELIKIFSTKKDACDYLNIKHSNRIYMCLTKKAKTAYGYIWREIKTDKFNHVLDIIY